MRKACEGGTHRDAGEYKHDGSIAVVFVGSYAMGTDR